MEPISMHCKQCQIIDELAVSIMREVMQKQLISTQYDWQVIDQFENLALIG